jgi:hypothetical protein
LKPAPDIVHVIAKAKEPVDRTPAGTSNKCGSHHACTGLN